MPPSHAVLVTGCSTGIGRSTALALARAGLPVWASARRTETLAGLAAAGCQAVELDVTDEASRARAVAAVEAEHGAVGVLVNNAGYAEAGPLEEITPEALQRQFDTNVFGLLRMCQLVLPGMRAQGSGTIVNIGSAGGLVTAPGGGAYHMTKYALESLSDALRLEVRPFGVRVVLLEPDAVRSQFPVTAVSRLQQPGDGADEPYARLKASYAALLERSYADGARGLLSPEDVARVVVRAVTSARPRSRYPVGLRARLTPVARRMLGDRKWDAVIGRMLPVQ
jgi:NAD(P)-dependent dehydrogenase (short-subunit alcohol dehydrogenase family)